jgi:hypothetical protein
MQQEVQQEKILVAVKINLTRYLAKISADINYKCNKCNKKKSLLHLLLQPEKFGKRRKRSAQAFQGVSVEGQIQGQLFVVVFVEVAERDGRALAGAQFCKVLIGLLLLVLV